MLDAGDRERLEREISEVRAREQAYRTQLAQQLARSSRLHASWQDMQIVFRGEPPSRSHLSRTLLDVARLSSRALEIRRTSVWLFDASRERLVCTMQLVDGVEQPSSGLELGTADHPEYVRALREEAAIAAEDVQRDPRTRELADYARTNGVVALLDIPIAIPGGLLGVVCHEHVGSPRTWHREEIDFASNVGGLVALALETERRLLAEHAAHGTEAKYRQLVESLPVTVYSFDVHSKKLDYLSPQVAQFGGWTAHDWLAVGADAWIDRIDEADRARVIARFEEGAVQGFPTELTYRVHLPAGGARWVRDTCALVRDHLGHAVAIQGTIADVTEQTLAERERRELERRYRTLLESVDLIAVLLDTKGKITFVNDACVRATGFSKQQCLGADWFDLMLAPDAREAVRARFVDDVRKGSVVPRFEVSLRTADGSERRVFCMNNVLRDSDGRLVGTSSLALDLTDRLRLEAEVLQQTKLESLGRLAAGVAHDFNNLLTVMVAQAALLDRFATQASDGQANEAARATLHSALEQAADLTRSLLVYGRQQPVANEVTSVDALVRDTAQLAEAIAGNDLHVTATLAAEEACVVADRSQLRQIVLNLVGNAADATRGHGSRIEIRTHVELIEDAIARQRGARRGGEFVVLSVRDDGRGMDSRTMSHIFDPFFTTKGSERGTGLGLPLCQSVVQRCGGFMAVDSEVGRGTEFQVYLPRETASTSSVPVSEVRSVAAVSESSPAPAPCVLVVEDMTVIRDLLARYLREAGYQVLEAGDVATATRLLASEAIDVLVTDGSLPDGSGQVLARSARVVRRAIRVLLVSGSGSGDDSFDAVLLKPFDQPQLLTAVSRLLPPRDARESSQEVGT